VRGGVVEAVEEAVVTEEDSAEAVAVEVMVAAATVADVMEGTEEVVEAEAGAMVEVVEEEGADIETAVTGLEVTEAMEEVDKVTKSNQITKFMPLDYLKTSLKKTSLHFLAQLV